MNCICAEWPGVLMLIQVGNQIQVFDSHAIQIAKAFRYPLDRVSRSHFAASLSIRFRSREKWLQRLRSSRQAYCLIEEEGYLRGGLKRRVLRECNLTASNGSTSFPGRPTTLPL